MGALKIQFERTTLPEVQRAIGLGSIRHRGDAGDSVNWLCYTAVAPGQNSRIWIEAHGEMGGPEEFITGIAVQAIMQDDHSPECPVLPKHYEPRSFDNGIWLGARSAAVSRAFPAGLIRRGDRAFVGYQGKVVGDSKCDGGYDLLNSLFLTFKSGVVIAIHAGQVTSC
ncbi:MAG: hypothetical protein JSS29_07040 [Proteobacteria bacterium]|nr:hypothetical protein [Pseudomonadota bacterium]